MIVYLVQNMRIWNWPARASATYTVRFTDLDDVRDPCMQGLFARATAEQQVDKNGCCRQNDTAFDFGTTASVSAANNGSNGAITEDVRL